MDGQQLGRIVQRDAQLPGTAQPGLERIAVDVECRGGEADRTAVVQEGPDCRYDCVFVGRSHQPRQRQFGYQCHGDLVDERGSGRYTQAGEAQDGAPSR